MFVGFYVAHQVLVLLGAHPVPARNGASAFVRNICRPMISVSRIAAGSRPDTCRISLSNTSRIHSPGDNPLLVATLSSSVNSAAVSLVLAVCVRAQRFRSSLSSVLVRWNSSNTPVFEKRYKALWKFQIAENKASAI